MPRPPSGAAASDASLARYLAEPTAAHRDAALARLTDVVRGSPRRRAELWSADGERVLHAASGAPLPPVERAGAAGVGPLRVAALEPGGDTAEGVLFYDVVARVPAGRGIWCCASGSSRTNRA